MMNLYFSEEEVKTLLEVGVTPELTRKLQAALELYPRLAAIGEFSDTLHNAKDAEYDAIVKSIKSQLMALEEDICHVESRGRLVKLEWLRLWALADFMER